MGGRLPACISVHREPILVSFGTMRISNDILDKLAERAMDDKQVFDNSLVESFETELAAAKAESQLDPVQVRGAGDSAILNADAWYFRS